MRMNGQLKSFTNKKIFRHPQSAYIYKMNRNLFI